MILYTLIFSGGKMDTHGVPERFNSYFILASEQQGFGVAIVTPLSSGPMPSSPHFVVPQGPNARGGQDLALNNAIMALRGLPGNKGLKENSEKQVVR
jgi:hypothetical protein